MGIFSSHHQEFSAVHSALVSFMQVSDNRFLAESGWKSRSILTAMVLSTKEQGGSNMTGTDLCVNKPHCAAAVRPWERVKPQPPPSLLLVLEPVQSCLGVARVMSEKKVPRSMEQRIVIKLGKSVSVGDTLPHTVVVVCGEFQRTGRFLQRGIWSQCVVPRSAVPSVRSSL